MTTYGVCNYDFHALEPKVENLKKFESYEEAFGYYVNEVMKDKNYPYTWDKTLWYVWIEGGDKIVQFEQLDIMSRCRIIKV